MNSNLVENQYSLSIRISSDGFSLFIYDEKHQLISGKHVKPEQDEDYTEFLQKMLVTHNEFYQSYNNIAIICESEYHTIVPEIFHNTENEREFLRLQHPSLPNSCLTFHTKLNTQQSILIYGLEEGMISTLLKYFRQITPESHLVNITKKIISEDNDKLTLWIRPHEIDCIVYKDHKIVLLNKYGYEYPEDILYHILNIYQQLEINPVGFKTEVFDNENTHNITLLKKHLPGIIIKLKKTAHEDYQWKI